MKRLLIALIATMILFAPLRANAQPVPQTEPPNVSGPDVLSVVIPKLDTDAVPLQEFLGMLQQKFGLQNCVVVRPPNAPDNYPVVPAMHLQSIALWQVLDLLGKAIPGAEVTYVQTVANSLPICVIKFPPPSDAIAVSDDSLIAKGDTLEISIKGLNGPGTDDFRQTLQVFSTGTVTLPLISKVQAAGLTPSELEKAISKAYYDAKILRDPQVSIGVQKPVSKPTINDDSSVQVYPLRDIVQSLAHNETSPDAQHKAIDDILSLIKAVLDMSDSEPSHMMIHEPTQTLIFKGNAQQRKAVEMALAALRPTENATAADEYRADMQRAMQESLQKAATQPSPQPKE